METQMAQASTVLTPAAPPPVIPGKPPIRPSLEQNRPLEQNRLKLICGSASDIANHFAAVLTSGTPFASVLNPGFWSNHAPQLRVGDSIEVHCDSRSWFGRVYVRDVTKTRASVSQLEYVEFGELAQSTDASLYRVKYAGPHVKWGIELVAEGKIVREGFETQEAAEVALKGLERSLTNKVS
jgi:hypothetical protein